MSSILVIDDNPEIRASVMRALEREGHSVSEAPDGKVALRHFAGNPTDLVISDVYMPDMDGIEFLIRVREAFPEVRIIMISGGGHLSKERVLDASSSLGANRVLAKPFSIEELHEAVQAALSSSDP